jgi:hypothetical protein
MSIKFFTKIFFATLGLIIISAIIGNILEAKGVLTKEMLGSKGITTVIALYFALFCVLAFSLAPLALWFFLNMQVKIGNAELVMIRWLQAHEQSVVYGFWGVIIIGLIIIIAMVKQENLFK